jgi:hypothetical protein
MVKNTIEYGIVTARNAWRGIAAFSIAVRINLSAIPACVSYMKLCEPHEGDESG